MGNKIVHIDFGGSDRKALGEWYLGVFNWNYDNSAEEMDYGMFQTEKGAGGGFVTTEDGKPSIVPYVSVADVDATIARIVETGGTIVHEKVVSPMVTFAVAQDPFGNQVGIVLDPDNA